MQALAPILELHCHRLQDIIIAAKLQPIHFPIATHPSTLSNSAKHIIRYLNECPDTAQPGWDAWLANGGGSYYNPEFAVENIDGLPNSKNLDYFPFGSNYTTSVVGNYSCQWITKVAGKGVPFFAYIAPKAAHDPFQPAAWYADYWGQGWPKTAPRPPSWNLTKVQLANHHPNVASQAVLTDDVANCIDKAFKDRWRTLMSVDDLVGDVYAKPPRPLRFCFLFRFFFSKK